MTDSTAGWLRSAAFHAMRAAFRAIPLAGDTRDRWRQEFLRRFPDLRPRGVRGRLPAGEMERRPRVHAGGRALGYVEHRREPLPDPLPATLVAFYLPQFHTIPENDAWWGKGFTEWRNVARALPQFEGHVQPRLPADLGFYDLRNPQVMRDQAALAAEYGIGAFCFYFYWFAGRTLLEAPLRQWLEDPSITLPFCLCWANENWSRRWDGRDEDVLVAQRHSPEDDLAFIAHVAAYLRDPRCLRVGGKPLLLVYRPGLLPDPVATAHRWRQWCMDNGVGEIVLAYVQAFERPDPAAIGFDAAVEFPPNLSTPPSVAADQALINPGFAGDVLDWRALADDYGTRPMPPYRLFPGVNCGWDNTPRRPDRGRVLLHASPDRYGRWLRDTVHRRLSAVPRADRLVFINAWNEWAEGATLEPDARLGHAWLNATQAALNAPDRQPASDPHAVVHAWYPDVFEELVLALRESQVGFRTVVTTTDDRMDDLRRIARKHGLEAEFVTGPNRGRDILPFLRALYHLRRDGAQCILKLHTKRSPHLPNGAEWRRDLVNRLVSPGRAGHIVNAFSRDTSLGLVVPEGYVTSLDQRLGANQEHLDYLCKRSGLPPPSRAADFPAGSMFWGRMEAFNPILDAHLHEWEFEGEQGQIDGTLAHAVERLFAECARFARLRVDTAAFVCSLEEPANRQASKRTQA